MLQAFLLVWPEKGKSGLMRLTEIENYVSPLSRPCSSKCVFFYRICVCKTSSAITPWITVAWRRIQSFCSEKIIIIACSDCVIVQKCLIMQIVPSSYIWKLVCFSIGVDSRFIISCSEKCASPSQKTECPLLQPSRQLSRQPAVTESSSSSDPRCLRLCWWCSGSPGTRSM